MDIERKAARFNGEQAQYYSRLSSPPLMYTRLRATVSPVSTSVASITSPKLPSPNRRVVEEVERMYRDAPVRRCGVAALSDEATSVDEVQAPPAAAMAAAVDGDGDESMEIKRAPKKLTYKSQKYF